MQFSRFDFVDRLRVTARKTISFQKRIAELGPAYLNCNERQTACSRRNANQREGCPTCEFTIQYQQFQKELEKELIAAGSSMEKVLKVSVFLNDIADYKGMNEVYKGRFGSKPPVRTTVAVAKGGVPGDSLVEMDCIAYV